MFSVSLETWIDFIMIGASEKHADPFLQLRDFYPWELVSISFRMIGLGPSVFLKLFFFWDDINIRGNIRGFSSHLRHF